MGYYGEAEVCELVVFYLLKKVSNIVDKKLLVYVEIMDLLYYKTFQAHKLNGNVKILSKCSKLQV